MVIRKIKEWFKRYLPAEIIGTITALSAATVIHNLYENSILTAYVGSFGEAIGFYSTVLIQNILVVAKKNKIDNKIFHFSDFGKIIGNLVLEFGPAGLIDGFLLRPFFLYLFPLLLKNFTIGILLGKIAGDFTFYILVIMSYEINKKNRKYKSHE
jgi:hypothetical protein